ncbi:hypothetical protein L3Q82_015326 [Scortum barcoo]|uniref:Uncharacterized protein n=1 Tax=Scortum barcoo TaxID=214431 RepID=A0ACB8VTM6_9TELE|nr:hypothetical protein L3Q82_015326 [Scortum barcoo]
MTSYPDNPLKGLAAIGLDIKSSSWLEEQKWSGNNRSFCPTAEQQENNRERAWIMCPAWLLVAVVAVGVARGAASECLEHPSCQEVNSESSMMECIQLCRPDLSADMPVITGDGHLKSLPPLSILSSSSSPQAKRSYSMEHFRWGKPVGRKRRPVKVYSSNGVEEESAEVFPAEMRRRELASEMIEAEDEEKAEEDQEQLPGDAHEKKDGTYKMKHFRWSGPPAKANATAAS